ncbi:hypothetical protein OIU79_007871 [Salix purpurea]|uniref:Uncharacterized protein n=1 Tax=Salix purpurea TaxID=77065 RepID=A0A9Q0TH09_SALPP|nr:hypothetical protein OIU79_007871 [Salix purpurea]
MNVTWRRKITSIVSNRLVTNLKNVDFSPKSTWNVVWKNLMAKQEMSELGFEKISEMDASGEKPNEKINN